jgi:hypothetical protein
LIDSLVSEFANPLGLSVYVARLPSAPLSILATLAEAHRWLVRGKVDFILIGGMAGILHGSARVTFDVDLPTLIRITKAAGREKDYEAIAELLVLLEEKSETVEWAIGLRRHE